MTQCDRIIRHLEDYGSITSLEAMKEYGIMRLASRITDLKRRGYKIVSETVSGENRYGETTYYSKYRFETETNMKNSNRNTPQAWSECVGTESSCKM